MPNSEKRKTKTEKSKNKTRVENLKKWATTQWQGATENDKFTPARPRRLYQNPKQTGHQTGQKKEATTNIYITRKENTKKKGGCPSE